MAYIGKSPAYGSAVSQQITGNNGTGYVLLYDSNTSGVVISLDGVVQRNSVDFNIVGTALTFTSTVASGIIINVVYTGLTLSFPTPSDNTVSLAKLTASGTASSSTFLRGDNSWATPAGGQITDSTVFFENWNTISSNQTTNLSSSKNMFVMGSISVTGSAVWTVSGTGNLNII
jgi:hypothetical protein